MFLPAAFEVSLHSPHVFSREWSKLGLSNICLNHVVTVPFVVSP